MIRIEEIISNALAGIEETEVAILARELLKTREALALAQQAKGEAEGRAALADRRAVSGRSRWVADVSAELDRARTKFPKPDLLTTAFAEEAGELVKAILDGYNGKASDVYGEAIQTIAMVVRLIEEGDPVHRLKPIPDLGAWFVSDAVQAILDATPEIARNPMDLGFVSARKKMLGLVPDYTGEGSAWVPPVEARAVVVPEAYPGQREHVAFLGALKYELENPTPDQKPTSFDINRDYFEHYANVFSKDNERMAHGVGFMNGAEWHRQHYAIPADRVPGEGMVAVKAEEWEAAQELLAQARCAAHAVEDEGECDMTGICRAVFACDSLRANQGGAAT